MNIINITSIISIIALAIMVISFFFKLFFKNLKFKKTSIKEKIDYLNSFKKGKCFFIYIVAIPLYLIGLQYVEKNLMINIIKSIGFSAMLVGLKFEFNGISKLIGESLIYKNAIIICFSLVIINAIMFIGALFIKNIFYFKNNIKWKISKNRSLVIGNNENNESIYFSCCDNQEKSSKVLLLDKFNKDEEKLLLFKNIAFMNIKSNEKYKDFFKKELSKAFKKKKRKITILINTLDDERNLIISKEISNIIITELDKSQFDINSEEYESWFIEKIARIKIYVFGNDNYEDVYLDMANQSKCIIHYINPFERIGFDFVKKYPFTKFIPEIMKEDDGFCIKKESNINVSFIGFGKTNQQVFLSSVASNQFLMRNDNFNEKNEYDEEYILKLVKYHIIDKNKSYINKMFNHNYYHFLDKFFKKGIVRDCKKEYEESNYDGKYTYPISFPYCDELNESVNNEYYNLPSIPAEQYYHRLDVNDFEFYSTIKTICENKNDLNIIVISFGSDLENIDLAKKLLMKKKEWKFDNVYIFVKVNNLKYVSEIIDNKYCFSFGTEMNDVYNINKIINSDLYDFAKYRNFIHDYHYKITNEPFSYKSRGTKESSEYYWYNMTDVERDSTIYSTMFFNAMVEYAGFNIEKNEVLNKENCSEEFKEFIKKNNKLIDILEFNRWNSFMISRGFVPASIKEIDTIQDRKEKYENRIHNCITSYKGLKHQYKKINNDCTTFYFGEDKSAFEYLSSNGYIIAKKKK